ncbi:MAG: hypothetical protein KDA60_05495 [Planctomycetales bacterium]|nr:hypothetical protein [Planctomycetales bacterium]
MLSIFAFWIVTSRSQAVPALTPARFASAMQLWEEQGLENYEIAIQVEGRQPAIYEVTVENGEPVRALRNGQPLPAGPTRGTWSVPGMFSTIDYDVEAVAKRENDPEAAQTPRLILRAEFNPQWGYPAKYERLELMTQNAVRWQVTRFVVHDDVSRTLK